MADDSSHELQRVVVHSRRTHNQTMPDGAVMLHGDDVIYDITGCTYERKTDEVWQRDYALPEHQPKDRSSRRN